MRIKLDENVDARLAMLLRDAGHDANTMDEVGQEIFDLSIRVASGEQTCAGIKHSASFGYLKQGPTF